LVGRAAEVGELARALGSGGGLVLVAGEAGIGKSRLVREFAARAADEGHGVIWGRPESVAGPGQYSVVLDMLEDLSVSSEDARPEALEMIRALGALEPGAEPPARQIAARVRGVLALLGDSRVAVIEDLHLADELSQAVVAHLARSARDDGTLLVATYRTEEASHERLARLLDLLTRDRIATTIELRALGADALREMLAAIWGTEPSPEDVEAIARLADGVPFFVEELAAARAAGAHDVPASISRAVLMRLRPLGDEAQAAMRTAALMTGAIDPAVLADATGLEDGAIARALVAGARAGLLDDMEGRLAFRHALIRRALADSVVSVEAAALHRAIAEAVERRYGSSPAHAAELARQWRAAGDRARAAAYALAAGARALGAGALEEAATLYDDVLALDVSEEARLDAVAGKAGVALRIGDVGESVRLYREAAAGNAARGRASEAAHALSRVASLTFADGDRSALDLLEEARGLAGDADPALFARLTIEEGYLLARYFDDPVAGGALLRDGAARAEGLGDARLRADAYEGLAWIAEFEGDADAAQRFGADACALALEIEDGELIGKVHGNQALRLTMRGRCEEAVLQVDHAASRLTGRIGTLYLHAVNNVRAWVLWRMGRPRDADEIAGRLEATKWARQYAGVVRAWAAMEAGDRERARALLDAWWSELGGAARRDALLADPKLIFSSEQSEVLVALAELIVRTHPGDALDDQTLELARAYEELCRDAAPDTRLLVSLLRARALIFSRRAAEASEILDNVETFVASSPYRLHEAAARELRGMCAADAGVAAKLLDESAEIYAACGNASDRARVMREAAEAVAASGGESADVAQRLKDARALAAEAGAAAELNRIESVMRAHGIRPRAGRPKGPRRAPGELSAREQEVAALVAAGASNAEVGARLFLSERTVQDHIANAQRRLGVTGRAGLAAWAAKHGLV
jgi:DNA-binding NarL/FixJ family response regulator